MTEGDRIGIAAVTVVGLIEAVCVSGRALLGTFVPITAFSLLLLMLGAYARFKEKSDRKMAEDWSWIGPTLGVTAVALPGLYYIGLLLTVFKIVLWALLIAALVVTAIAAVIGTAKPSPETKSEDQRIARITSGRRRGISRRRYRFVLPTGRRRIFNCCSGRPPPLIIPGVDQTIVEDRYCYAHRVVGGRRHCHERQVWVVRNRLQLRRKTETNFCFTRTRTPFALAHWRLPTTIGRPEVLQYSLTVKFPTGIGRDRYFEWPKRLKLDLAQVEVSADGLVEGKDYIVVPDGSSVNADVGDRVIAVGNPFGELEGTHTFGMVSAIR